MKRYDYITNIYCKELDTDIKGFMSKKNLDALSSSSRVGYVLKGMEYRPDKIAYYYLEDPKLSWLITLANGFTNGIADYYPGRKLIIPNNENILSLERE